MVKTTQHYSLTTKQLHVLKLIYKFRFVSASLLAKYRDVSYRSRNKVLRILLEQGYIGRFYTKSYRLHGEAASYYLKLKGIKLLRDEHGISQKALKLLQRNKTISSTFVDHMLEVMQ